MFCRRMFCPHGRFVPTDVLSAGCYITGSFVPLDILSAGCFVCLDVLSRRMFCPEDILCLWTFCTRMFCLRTFCLWTFCLGTHTTSISTLFNEIQYHFLYPPPPSIHSWPTTPTNMNCGNFVFGGSVSSHLVLSLPSAFCGKPEPLGHGRDIEKVIWTNNER